MQTFSKTHRPQYCIFALEFCQPFNLPNGTVDYGGSLPVAGRYPVFTIVTLSCDDGFDLVGLPEARCGIDFSTTEKVTDWFDVFFMTRATQRCEGNKINFGEYNCDTVIFWRFMWYWFYAQPWVCSLQLPILVSSLENCQGVSKMSTTLFSWKYGLWFCDF